MSDFSVKLQALKQPKKAFNLLCVSWNDSLAIPNELARDSEQLVVVNVEQRCSIVYT